MQNSQSTQPVYLTHYYLGCPVWNLPAWKGILFARDAEASEYLRQYSLVFNSVEGNTSFYGLPKQQTLMRWAKETYPHFRFCLKLPRTITHHSQLQGIDRELTQFYHTISSLKHKMGLVHIQLPPQFSPQQLPTLKNLIPKLSKQYQHCVEVRHLGFFDKANNEKQLNHLLAENYIDRTCFDSRALFKARPNTPEIIEAQRKKPRLPVHAYTLKDHPMIRFVGNPNLDANQPYLVQWVNKVAQWIREGKTPYVFIHTAANFEAPILARQFHQLLRRQLTDIASLPAFPAETSEQSQQMTLI